MGSALEKPVHATCELHPSVRIPYALKDARFGGKLVLKQERKGEVDVTFDVAMPAGLHGLGVPDGPDIGGGFVPYGRNNGRWQGFVRANIELAGEESYCGKQLELRTRRVQDEEGWESTVFAAGIVQCRE
eukprot:TRINITY_DN37389_c0_g1_i1.p1 TRINITY_DN37389_c0_g1~~TRINITY_DN37389_c0_g1_i1.p1  ORF type:complete len:144 (+),score=59.20 TRINITY_DN37389_c0_g1_i1:45-434(+)